MILLTTSWKLIFAAARKDEAQEQAAEGREAETLPDSTNAESAEREPQPSGCSSERDRSRIRR